MEYKFRGKRIDNKKWVVGNLLQRHDSLGALSLIEVQDKEMFEIEVHQVYPESVGMWTGLKDKSGIDIYEGDVLRGFQKGQKDKDGKHGFDTTDTVYWRNGGFKAFGKSLQDGYTKEGNILYQFMWCNPGHFATPDHYCQLDDIEIIGNIHDVNPAGGQSSVDNMLHDPNVKAADANGQATEQQAAQESAAQDTATGASESAEEGGAEG